MTLLTIAQAVANDIPVAVPQSVVGNSDSTAQLILQQSNLAGEALARKPQGGWVAMIREYDFQTSALGPIDGTVANSGPNGNAVISGLTIGSGSINPIEPLTWYAFGDFIPNNAIVSAVTLSDPDSTVTLNMPATNTGAGQFTFGQSDYSLPTDFERPIDNTMWDRSRFWSMRGPQSPQQWQLYKSSVIGRASIQRRFRFRNIGGNSVFSIDPVPTDNGSWLVFEFVSNGWCQSDTGVYQDLWQADTDTGVLDEYLIQLGTRWRVLRRLGISYAEELDEYEREVSKAMAQDGGAAILDLTPNNNLTLIGPWNLPETNFGNLNGN